MCVGDWSSSGAPGTHPTRLPTDAGTTIFKHRCESRKRQPLWRRQVNSVLVLHTESEQSDNQDFKSYTDEENRGKSLIHFKGD